MVTDFAAPGLVDPARTPAAGRVGTEITVSFGTTEAVIGIPSVTVGSQRFVLVAFQDGRFALSHTLTGQEGEGDIPVQVGLQDLAGNASQLQPFSVRTDFTAPDLASFSAAPSLARTGTTVTRRPSKRDFLRTARAWNERARLVESESFAQSDFFDPRDKVQVKYEMLRAHHADGAPVSAASRQHGYSRESFYAASEAFKAGSRCARTRG